MRRPRRRALLVLLLGCPGCTLLAPFSSQSEPGEPSADLPTRDAAVDRPAPRDAPAEGDLPRAEDLPRADDLARDLPRDASGDLSHDLPPQAPQLLALELDSCLRAGEQTTISATASDPAGGPLTYDWRATPGLVVGSGPSVVFNAPINGPDECPYRVKLVLTSTASGLSTSRTFDIFVHGYYDLDGSGTVDFGDFRLMSAEFGTCGAPGQPPCKYDVTGDGLLGITDIATLGGHFGEHGCGCPQDPAQLPIGLCPTLFWCWLHPRPQGNDLRGVWAASATEYAAVGERRTVLRRAGTSFYFDALLVSGAEANDIWGRGPTDIYVVGEASDHGFTAHYDGTAWGAAHSSFVGLRAVGGCDGDVFAGGEAGTVLRRDGSGWVGDPLPGATGAVTGVACAGATAWAVTEHGQLFRRDATWDVVISSSIHSWEGIWLEPTTDLHAAGARNVGPTEIGVIGVHGTGWSATTVTGVKRFTSVWGNGATVLLSGEQLATTHRGVVRDLNAVQHETAAPLADIWVTAGGEAVSVGAAGTVATFDGTVWRDDVAPLTTATLRGVWAAGADAVIAVGDGGTVLRFDGSAWSALSPPTTEDLHDVWGSAISDVVVVGDGQRVLEYDGTSWDSVYSGGAVYRAVWGASADAVYAVRDDGWVARRHLGGNWTLSYPVSGASYRDLWGRSASDIWLAGADGLLVHTDGSSWEAHTAPFVGDIEGIGGTADALFIAAGGWIRQVALGQSTWLPVIGGKGAFHDIWSDGSRILAVGDAGTLVERNAAGHWRAAQGAVPPRAFWGAGGSSDHLFAVGARGAVLVRVP